MLKLSEIMTRDVITVAPETTLREAVELFTAKHISGAPVVRGHELVGVVSASDILEFAASLPERLNESVDDSPWSESTNEDDSERADAAPGSYYTSPFASEDSDVANRLEGAREASVLDAHTVDEVMTHHAIALSPNDTVLAAADVMRGHSIHRVLVVDEGKLVGILSTIDLARAVADRRVTTRTYVFNKDRDFCATRFPL